MTGVEVLTEPEPSGPDLVLPGEFWEPGPAERPGEYLQRVLDNRGMSQAELARLSGFARTGVNGVRWGKRSITPGVALRLERALGVPAIHWLHLQAVHDLDQARKSQ